MNYFLIKNAPRNSYKMQTEEEVKNALADALNDIVAVDPAAATPPLATPAVKKPRAKKLGRPPKKSVKPAIPIEVRGIIAAPVNPGDIVEMIYSSPELFKKLFALLKGYVVSEVELNFDQNGLRIETMDRIRKTRIIENVAGNCMNMYYCREPVRVWVKRTDLDRVFGSLNKTEYKVTWMLNEKNRHILYIVIKGSTYNSDQIFEVDIFEKATHEAIARDDDTAYPVKFKIALQYLKKQITSVAKTAKVLTIQKTGTTPLQMTVGKTATSNVCWTEVFDDGSAIELQSTIALADIFNVSVEVASILPFCKYAIGADAYIAADKTERISFQCFTDKKEAGWAASVKIYSEIIKAPGGHDRAQ